MKAPPFAYVAPDHLDGVVHALVEEGEDAKVLAGGQSLLPLLALRLARPTVLVDVGRVPGLDAVAVDDAGLVLGAAVTHATLERDPVVAREVPLLAEVAPSIGHTAIRTRGTIGGSLAHADPAAEWPAIAVLLDAAVAVRGPEGSRRIPAAELFDGYLTTTLAEQEVVEAVHVPRLAPGAGAAFAEVSRRHGDFALVGVGARVQLDTDGRIGGARLAFLGVAPTPVLDDGVGEQLAGTSPGAADGALAEVARAAAARLDPPDDLHASAAYRRRVAAHLGARVLGTALTRAREAAA